MIPGAVVTTRGDLVVSGSVGRDAIAVGGDVIVRQGGVIGGDALAVDGRVRVEGGSVRGETRSIAGPLGLTPATAVPGSKLSTMWHQLLLSLGWLAILAAIGAIVVLFARTNLEAVADAIERNFGRAFVVGIAAELAVLPALMVLIVVLLLIPIVGWALLPFAVIGFLVAVAGALALGFLAMAQVTGEAVMRRTPQAGAVSSASCSSVSLCTCPCGSSRHCSRGAVRRAARCASLRYCSVVGGNGRVWRYAGVTRRDRGSGSLAVSLTRTLSSNGRRPRPSRESRRPGGRRQRHAGESTREAVCVGFSRSPPD